MLLFASRSSMTIEPVRMAAASAISIRRAGPTKWAQYPLGTDSEEVRRLEEQHRVWREDTAALWDRAGFGAGDCLLDLGCGPGFAAIELAQRVGPEGRVLAVDESAQFIESLAGEADRLEFRHVTALVERAESLQVAPATLDGAFARWVFSFLSDPASAVAAVAQGLRAGGRFVILDYLNYLSTSLHPRSAGFDRVVSVMAEFRHQSNMDLDIGGRLPSLVAGSGFRVLEIIPIVRFSRPGSDLWNWMKRFYSQFVPRLVEAGVLTVEDLRRFEREWRDRERDPGAFAFNPPIIGIIAERL